MKETAEQAKHLGEGKNEAVTNETGDTCSCKSKKTLKGEFDELSFRPEAFADMRRDFRAGSPWRGVVKNRRKDGGFTLSSPTSRQLAKTDWSSVTNAWSRPNREYFTSTECAFERIKDGDESPQIRYGWEVRHRPAWLPKAGVSVKEACRSYEEKTVQRSLVRLKTTGALP